MAEPAEPSGPGYGHPVSEAMLWTFRLFAALAFVAGVLLFVLTEHTDRYFSWTIKPPLTAAFLGASYWAACVLIADASRRRIWAAARPALPPVLVIAVLLEVATLIHLDRFHRDSLFGWFWIVVYAIVPAALVVLMWRERGMRGEAGATRVSLPPGLRVALALQAAVMLGVGASLFLAPETADSLWPWSLTPLTARALGAFVFGFGVSAADAARASDLVRFRGAAIAYFLLGALELVAVARYPGDLGDTLLSVLYLGFVSSVVAVGLAGSWSASRALPASS